MQSRCCAKYYHFACQLARWLTPAIEQGVSLNQGRAVTTRERRRLEEAHSRAITVSPFNWLYPKSSVILSISYHGQRKTTPNSLTLFPSKGKIYSYYLEHGP